jgi:uncharacterized membrane protein
MWSEADMGAFIAFASGLIFGIGLIISGMTDPQRVLAFLDIAGAWNAALALVMGGAVAVALPVFAYARSRGNSLPAAPCSVSAGASAASAPGRR